MAAAPPGSRRGDGGAVVRSGGVEALHVRVDLAVLAVIRLAVDLRAAVNVIGPLLPEIRADLGLSGPAAGALTALPTFCFAFLGATGPSLSRRFGPTRTIVAGLVGLAAGQLLRAVVPGLPPCLGNRSSPWPRSPSSMSCCPWSSPSPPRWGGAENRRLHRRVGRR